MKKIINALLFASAVLPAFGVEIEGVSGCYCVDYPDENFYEIYNEDQRLILGLEGTYSFVTGTEKNKKIILMHYTQNANDENLLIFSLIDCQNQKKSMFFREQATHESGYKFMIGEKFIIQKSKKDDKPVIIYRITDLLKRGESF